MSPWSGERWVAVLSPERVALVRRRRGRNAACALHAQRACADRSAEAAVDALRFVLAEEDVKRGELTLLVSSHFVQYLMIPWRAGLASPKELATFAELCFEETFGAEAGARSVVVARERAGSPRMAAALGRSWLATLESAVAGSPLRLVSVQPYLCALFDRVQPGLRGDDFMLLVAEPARSCVLVASDGRWRSVRSMGAPVRAGDLAHLIEREVQLCGLADGVVPPVFVHAPGHAGLKLPRCNGVVPQHLDLGDADEATDDPLLAMAETAA